MKKIFAIIGIICGCIVILFGVLLMVGAFTGEMASTSSAYLYDTGYGSFGADFYTYVNNNAALAGDAASAAASNTRGIGELLQVGMGILTIAFGLFMGCFFGMKLGIIKDKERTKDCLVPKDDPKAVSGDETVAKVEEIVENPEITEDSEKEDISEKSEAKEELISATETEES